MNARLWQVALGGLSLIGTLAAAEIWARPWTEWSAADVDRVLNHSPWAGKASVSFEGQNGNGSSFPGGASRGGGGGWGGTSGAGGGMGGRSGGMGGPGGGGGGGWSGVDGAHGRPRNTGDETQGTRAKLDVLVRWESALPVRQALLKQRFGDELPKPGQPNYTLDQAQPDYVLSVSGLRNANPSFYGRSSGEGSSLSRWEETLRSAAELVVKNRTSIEPHQVKVEPLGDGTTVARFFFPRSVPIGIDDGEVTLSLRTSWMKLDRKFKLKDMVVDGGLAL